MTTDGDYWPEGNEIATDYDVYGDLDNGDDVDIWGDSQDAEPYPDNQ